MNESGSSGNFEKSILRLQIFFGLVGIFLPFPRCLFAYFSFHVFRGYDADSAKFGQKQFPTEENTIFFIFDWFWFGTSAANVDENK